MRLGILGGGRRVLVAGLCLALALWGGVAVRAQEGFLGEVRLFAGNFAPKGWAFCHGQRLRPEKNQALFSILGIAFGGDGRTSFALPDLRGRVVVAAGTGSGLGTYHLGEAGGREAVTVSLSQVPSHAHPAFASNQAGSQGSPAGQLVAVPGGQAFGTASPVAMSAATIGAAGGGQPVDVRQPYQALNYIICIGGTMPIRP